MTVEGEEYVTMVFWTLDPLSRFLKKCCLRDAEETKEGVIYT